MPMLSAESSPRSRRADAADVGEDHGVHAGAGHAAIVRHPGAGRASAPGRGPAERLASRVRGKRPTRAKVLWWDRNGYCLLYNRSSGARLRWLVVRTHRAEVRAEGS